MKKLIIISAILLGVLLLTRGVYYAVRNATYKPQTGDVIFHVSKSDQSAAIKIGTLSRYSHCGIVVVENGKSYVIEAERGVEKTPMKTWLRRGKMCHHYRVMRLKDTQDLTVRYKGLLGIPYDRAFRFDNGMYYCSELVWEIYKKNGILLSEPNPLGDYHFLNLPIVKRHLKRRHMTLDQKVVPPSDLVKSSKLRTVSYGYSTPHWL